MRQLMPLTNFLATVKDGDEHGWEHQIGYLILNHPSRLQQLKFDVRNHGIQEPIHIGQDGRCWDGHHRVAVAVLLNLTHIPVRDDRPDPVRAAMQAAINREATS